MTRTKSIRQGNQASDELGPVMLVFLWVFIAALLVVPAICLFHLLTGNAEAAGDWAAGSIVCVLVALLLLAGLRSSARDTRQLRARGVPGTAAVISVRPEEDGYSAVLRIRVDGLEPFESRARSPWGQMSVGDTVEVLVDPSDRLFTIVR
ncbi:hypothetical protein N1027_11805 [Herbiconiux sp. CPCC 205763]|uniref:NfeD-like C-terminal domain-containing protein n=1 Tax=Herbiconiux aconitum TaxID=2970913 RepID=A0ABT2GV62_9MICO|nr:hypothetical protein [Herbiconiux aconitum]MCS5718819.1 hypothetical protein [Herbiconiux aconitum]